MNVRRIYWIKAETQTMNDNKERGKDIKKKEKEMDEKQEKKRKEGWKVDERRIGNGKK